MVKENETLNDVQVSFFCPDAIMLKTQVMANLIEQQWLRRSHEKFSIKRRK
jgi:hypothetical protein